MNAGVGALAVIVVLTAYWKWQAGQGAPTGPASGQPTATESSPVPAPSAPIPTRDPSPAPIVATHGAPTAVTTDLPTAPPTAPAPALPQSFTSSRLRVLVPAYFYPAGKGLDDWNRLIQAASRVPVIAIVNPASGPGTEPNPDYARIVRKANEGGVVLLGYVNTQYGKRDRAEVEGDIDHWIKFYPEIRGIFFDAMASDNDHVEYYKTMSRLVLRKLEKALVVTNPGTLCGEPYFSQDVQDIAILFENYQGFNEFKLPPWTGRYDIPTFAALPYKITTADEMKLMLEKAVVKGFGTVYITDLPEPNPWTRLPSYWDVEIDLIQQTNRRPTP